MGATKVPEERSQEVAEALVALGKLLLVTIGKVGANKGANQMTKEDLADEESKLLEVQQLEEERRLKELQRTEDENRRLEQLRIDEESIIKEQQRLEDEKRQRHEDEQKQKALKLSEEEEKRLNALLSEDEALKGLTGGITEMVLSKEDAPALLTKEEAKANPLQPAGQELIVESSHWAADDNTIIELVLKISQKVNRRN